MIDLCIKLLYDEVIRHFSKESLVNHPALKGVELEGNRELG